MTTRKPDDTKPKDLLPGEAELACVYRAGGKEAPPPALDARILAEARRAVAKPAGRGLFGSHWAIPLSTAAVMVLTLGVLLVVNEQSPLDRRDEIAPALSESPALSAPDARPASPAPPTAQTEAKTQAQTPKDTASPLPSRERGGGEGEKAVAVGKTDLPESTPGADTLLRVAPPAEEAKKIERPGTAAAPAAQRENLADERAVSSAQGEVRAKAKLAKEANMRIAADVITVQVSGAPGAYQFDVTVRSPDTGCQQYADWWEVVSADGRLLYRRVLAHSHVDEQPFTRSGGPVPIQPDTVVWVRAHMNTGGYGGTALKGSVKNGFAKSEPPANYAASLAKQPPLPDGCAF